MINKWKNTIQQMDCLEGMKQLPDKCIDLIITDPPYNINLKPQRKKTESIKNDNMSSLEFIDFIGEIFKEINRVLKDDSFLIIFVGWSTIPEFRGVLDKYFELKSMPIWIKNNFGIGYYTRPQYEPCFLYLKGKPKPLEKPISDVWKFDKVHTPVHSCEKPKKLMNHILYAFSKKEQIVLDPFMGSGTTAISCQELGRDFIGFELEPKYIEIAKIRLSQQPLLII